ncbi:MAG: LytR/AlgR family response regulator transcription factor [Eisenbergiella massiliensis]
MIETPSRFERVEYDEIIYLYREKKYAVLVLQDRQVHVRKPLRVVFEELDSENFMFIERGFVVNIEHILRLADRDLTMRNGDVLPVGRTYLKTVKRMLLHFWKDRI